MVSTPAAERASLIKMKLILILLLMCTWSATAAAAGPVPPPDVDAAAWLQAIYVAVTSKNWGLVVGIALIGLVYPLRLWGPAVFKSKLGGLMLAFLVSLAGTFGAALAAGAHPNFAMVVTALTTAATAAGLWEWIKAHLPGAQAAADKATAPVQPPSNIVRGSIV
jgi:hypothetical protein